jgi:hypothetical protein
MKIGTEMMKAKVPEAVEHPIRQTTDLSVLVPSWTRRQLDSARAFA